MEAVEVTLPGGFERDGAWQRSVWLRPWCGHDEVWLAEDAAAATPAARTTVLLSRCLSLDGGVQPGAAFARDLTVGDREALLLHLRRITLGERLSSVLTCPSCGEKMDLDLEVADLLVPPYEHEARLHQATLNGGADTFRVRFRLPTGGDQERAARQAASDPPRAARELLERCVESITAGDETPVDEVPETVAERLPRLMAELDPQAELWLDAACPSCEKPFRALFDSARFLRQEIVQSAARLYREVHLLAYHYHWSESEILGMTGRKRRRYLELLAETLGGEKGR